MPMSMMNGLKGRIIRQFRRLMGVKGRMNSFVGLQRSYFRQDIGIIDRRPIRRTNGQGLCRVVKVVRKRERVPRTENLDDEIVPALDERDVVLSCVAR